MRRFRFHRATSLQEALELKARFGPEGRILAGGTDLLVALREESPSLPPVEVIDVTPLAELRGISRQEETPGRGGPAIRIGSLVTHADVEQSPMLMSSAALLAQAAAEIGSPQIRNRGTIGGNICNASPCADTLPALLALEAELTIHSVRGSRQVSLAEAILAPYKTVLTADELLTAIRFRPLLPGAGSAFRKLGRRRALSISRLSMAVVLGRGTGGVLSGVRIAAGSVAPTPRRFAEVERLLEGATASPELFAAAGRKLAEEMVGITGRRWSTPYKEPVVAALLQRALAAAQGGNGTGEQRGRS